MNLVLAFGIVLVVSALAVAAMLLVRRHSPEGGRFTDGDRAAGVFGVLATGFSVLLGFIIFLNFTSYDASRAGAEAEALVVAQQVQTAVLLPASVSSEVTGELICYSRSVVGPEWDRLEAGDREPSINPWGAAMFTTLRDVKAQTPIEQAAYDRWMEQTSERERARDDRIHGASGITPLPLWVVLIFISIVIFVYLLFFADSGEAAVVQGMLMGSVMSVLTVLLLLLAFLSNPFQNGVGGLRPTAMERTISLIDKQLVVAHVDVQPPCDDVGEKLP